MQTLKSKIQQNDLNQIVQILNLSAKGGTSQAQKMLYKQLSQIQTNQLSYIYLTFVYCNNNYENILRSYAALALKSALSRNKGILQLQAYNLIKYAIFQNYNQNNPALIKFKGILISQLTVYNTKKIDYQILFFLVSKLAQKDAKALNSLVIILQDLRFNNQNFQIFGSDQFHNFMQKLIIALQPIFMQNNLKLQAMKCMNLIIYPLPQNLLNYLQSYIGNVLVPAIINNDKKQILIGLQGLSSVAQSKRNFITRDTIAILLQFQSNDKQITKIQANLWIQVVDGDQQQALLQFIQPLLKKLIKFLIITEQDMKNMKEQSNLFHPQGNQYNQQQQEQNQKQIGMLMRGGQFTLRKASVISLQKLSIYHNSLIWQKGAIYIKEGLQSNDWKFCEAICLFIGTITPQVISQISSSFQQIIKILYQKLIKNQSIYLAATIIWCYEKFTQLIIKNQQLYYQCIKLIFSLISNKNQNEAYFILVQACFACLDQFVQQKQAFQNQKEQKSQKIKAQVLRDMIKISLQTVQSNNFRGNTLFSAFKLLSIIIEDCYEAINQTISDEIINILCRKWNQNINNQQMICPLIQCLVILCQKKQASFNKFSYQIFVFSMNIISNIDAKNIHTHKSVILRIMDLLSSIISLKNQEINVKIGSKQYLTYFLKLLMTAEQQQIKNFTYGLIGDVAKQNSLLINSQSLQSQLQTVITTIAQSIDKKHMTSCNNGLLCLTDILCSFEQNLNFEVTVQKFLPDIIQMALNIILRPNIQRIYCPNFCKIIGRLTNINQEIAIKYVKNNMRIICNGLRTNLISSQTDSAFNGIFKIYAKYMKQVGNQFQYVIDAFICYPTHNSILRDRFLYILRQFYKLLTSQQWSAFLSKQIFLPATAIKINSLVSQTN